jgi:hypothetical protein
MMEELLCYVENRELQGVRLIRGDKNLGISVHSRSVFRSQVSMMSC